MQTGQNLEVNLKCHFIGDATNWNLILLPNFTPKYWKNLTFNSEWNLDLTDSEHRTLQPGQGRQRVKYALTSFLLIVNEHELAVLEEFFYESICLTSWSI